MAPDTVDTDLIEQELVGVLPGGKWILPHWQEGPYWLVIVQYAPDPNWQVQLVIEAIQPLVTGLPRWCHDLDTVTPVDVYALPQFLADLLRWHAGEELFLAEQAVGPFDTWPTAADAVRHLRELVGMTPEQGMEIYEDLEPVLEQALTTLTAAGPGALQALAGLDLDALAASEEWARQGMSLGDANGEVGALVALAARLDR